MKKKKVSRMLTFKKSVVATLSDQQAAAVRGGSTVTTSVLRALCATINPLNCTMSAQCAP